MPISRHYPVLAWDHNSIYAGTIGEDGLDMQAWRRDCGLDDIRNCSWAGDARVVVASGVNPRARRHELWSMAYPSGQETVLMGSDYILHNAVERSGRRTAFTAGPSPSRDDVSLHVYDARPSEARCVVEGSISRGCIPSWQPDGDRITASTIGHQVVVVEADRGGPQTISPGDYPAFSPDGDRIAFVSDGSVAVAELGDPAPPAILWRPSASSGAVLRAISWSADAQLLLATVSAGIAGKAVRFARIDVGTRRARMFAPEGLRGMCFR
jgi:Tol biopolymer transport system component